MEGEKVGVKELKDVQIAVNELAICLIEVFKDGVQASDALELINKMKDDEGIKAKLLEAYNGIKAVPAEIADIDVMEAVELVIEQSKFVPRIIEAFKKPVVSE